MTQSRQVLRTQNAVLRKIRRGILPVGARINETTLSRDFNMSRTPVREALNRLVGQGVLVSLPGVGFAVCSAQAAELAQLQAARGAILAAAVAALTQPDALPLRARLICLLNVLDQRVFGEWGRRDLMQATLRLCAAGSPPLVGPLHRIERRLSLVPGPPCCQLRANFADLVMAITFERHEDIPQLLVMVSGPVKTPPNKLARLSSVGPKFFEISACTGSALCVDSASRSSVARSSIG